MSRSRRAKWRDMDEDVLVRIYDHLGFKDRVRDTVLVCKRWSSLCLQNSPRGEKLRIPLTASSCATLLPWAAQQGPHVRHLHLNLGKGLPKSLVVQTLGLSLGFLKLRSITLQFPPLPERPRGRKLRSLKEDGRDWDNIVPGFQLLRKLECLHLLNVKFVPREWGGPIKMVENARGDLIDENNAEEDFSPQDFFKGLNLQELKITSRELNYMTQNPFYTRALGKALQALTQLTKLDLAFSHLDLKYEKVVYDEDDLDVPGWGDFESDPWQSAIEYDTDQVANCIAKLPSLRDLKLSSKHAMELGPNCSRLTNLTSLKLSAKIRDCSCIATVPALQDLHLQFLEFTAPGNEGIVIPAFNVPRGSLIGLSKLSLSVDSFSQVDPDKVLPKTAIAQIPGLVHFKLAVHGPGPGSPPFAADHEKWSIALDILTSMPHLTILDLRKCYLTALPTSLMALDSMRTLNLGYNPNLELSEGCMNILHSLRLLRQLYLDKKVWCEARSGSLSNLGKTLPNLTVGVYYHDG